MKQYWVLLSLVTVTTLFAQETGSDDLSAVQTIITKCGLSASAADITVMENGRVVSLNIKNK